MSVFGSIEFNMTLNFEGRSVKFKIGTCGGKKIMRATLKSFPTIFNSSVILCIFALPILTLSRTARTNKIMSGRTTWRSSFLSRDFSIDRFTWHVEPTDAAVSTFLAVIEDYFSREGDVGKLDEAGIVVE